MSTHVLTKHKVPTKCHAAQASQKICSNTLQEKVSDFFCCNLRTRKDAARTAYEHTHTAFQILVMSPGKPASHRELCTSVRIDLPTEKLKDKNLKLENAIQSASSCVFPTGNLAQPGI